MVLTQEQQDKAAKHFSDQVNKLLEGLKKFSKEREEAVSQNMNNWTLIATILPIIMALVSTGLVFLTEEVLTSLTSAVDVFPPFLVRRAKTQVEFFQKNRKIRVHLELLQGSINRQAIIGDLTEAELKEAEIQIRKYDGLVK